MREMNLKGSYLYRFLCYVIIIFCKFSSFSCTSVKLELQMVVVIKQKNIKRRKTDWNYVFEMVEKYHYYYKFWVQKKYIIIFDLSTLFFGIQSYINNNKKNHKIAHQIYNLFNNNLHVASPDLTYLCLFIYLIFLRFFCIQFRFMII